MQSCRRRQPRYAFGENTPASLEFRYPHEDSGQAFQVKVVDMSASGLGFLLEEDYPPGLELGTSILGATFCWRERRIAMDLLVLHVTEHFAGRAVCGCLSYPKSDADLIAFKALLADLTAQAERAEAEATS